MSASLVGSEMCIRDSLREPRSAVGLSVSEIVGILREALQHQPSLGDPSVCLLYTSDAADDM
eukprot:1224096-Alexandrium_andersonii.AAC.1